MKKALESSIYILVCKLCFEYRIIVKGTVVSIAPVVSFYSGFRFLLNVQHVFLCSSVLSYSYHSFNIILQFIYFHLFLLLQIVSRNVACSHSLAYLSLP